MPHLRRRSTSIIPPEHAPARHGRGMCRAAGSSRRVDTYIGGRPAGPRCSAAIRWHNDRMRILVLDLDGRHGQNLRVVLEEAGHDVELAAAPPFRGTPDLVVLAGAAAVSMCAMLRARDPVIPILLLTDRGLVEDRVAGLRAGADDCVEVPFAPSQMMARVDALGRRARLLP